MRENENVILSFAIMATLLIFVGVAQSWGVALSILNLCLISAVMSIGVNIQWGYAGLINFGVMGFTALGGLAAVLVSVDPIEEESYTVSFKDMVSKMDYCRFAFKLKNETNRKIYTDRRG